MIASEELSKLSLEEKVKQHARDVMETENNPEYLNLEFVTSNFIKEEKQVAKYHAEEGKFIYNFLLGFGSLGHPIKPSKIGNAVYEVARQVGAKVSFLDFTYAEFDKKINPEAIEKAFYPIWEESERLKAKDKIEKEKINSRSLS